MNSRIKNLNIKIPYTEDTYINRYLTSVNGVLRLSRQELEVLAAIVRFSTDPTGDVCNTETRKIVLRETGMKSSTSLTNVIRAIVKKKALVTKTEPKRHYRFHPIVEAALYTPEKITLTYFKPVADNG